MASQTGTGRCQQNCGRTTKPSTFESLIALPPAGSAFFSLVFFAEAKKSDRRPPQGDVVFLWVQKPTPLKQTAPPQGDVVQLLDAETNTVNKKTK
ncbi:hypothetical protein ACU4GI_03530 [Cupriavidus basilensis]